MLLSSRKRGTSVFCSSSVSPLWSLAELKLGQTYFWSVLFRILFLLGILWKQILWSINFWKFYTLCSHLEKSVNGSILKVTESNLTSINQIFLKPSLLCTFFISSLLFIAWTTQVLKIILNYLKLNLYR